MADWGAQETAVKGRSGERGVLFLVVGPSGAGKDTLIDAARLARPDLHYPRRVITRPALSGGEAHTEVSAEAFDVMEAENAFALSWRAHGLAYGVPIDIDEALVAGRDVVANVSRSVIERARTRFAPVRVLVITAAAPVLAARLAARGRENEQQIADRLTRSTYQAPQGEDVVWIDNGGDLDTGVAAFLGALSPSAETGERA
ncbi:MAG: phosphonate metabolism protein/1,5-bisphosphokinase (PRPP-forming) PhnN [Pseudomonadota bacterium]